MSRRAQSLSFRAKQKGGMSLSPGGSMHGTINLIDVDARWEQLEATIIHLSGANLAAAASTPPADGPLPYYTEWRELRGIDTDLAWPLKNKHRSWDLLPETPRAGGKLHEVDTAFNAHRYRDSSILYLRLHPGGAATKIQARVRGILARRKWGERPKQPQRSERQGQRDKVEAFEERVGGRCRVEKENDKVEVPASLTRRGGTRGATRAPRGPGGYRGNT